MLTVTRSRSDLRRCSRAGEFRGEWSMREMEWERSGVQSGPRSNEQSRAESQLREETRPAPRPLDQARRVIHVSSRHRRRHRHQSCRCSSTVMSIGAASLRLPAPRLASDFFFFFSPCFCRSLFSRQDKDIFQPVEDCWNGRARRGGALGRVLTGAAAAAVAVSGARGPSAPAQLWPQLLLSNSDIVMTAQCHHGRHERRAGQDRLGGRCRRRHGSW